VVNQDRKQGDNTWMQKKNNECYILSKINRKLTLLFIIVGFVAPALAIYYFYYISINSFTVEISLEQTTLLGTIVICIIILIAIDTGFIGFLISRNISKPIKELCNATKEVEKGNYDIRLDIKSKDEIGELLKSFNKTTSTLAKIEEQRREIDRAKTEFLSITSHELRSPMTPMKAQLQMLKREYFGKLSKDQKKSLEIIIRNADRLDNIIADFLEISRIEAARLKFNFQETDIKHIIEETIEFMNAFAREKNIKLVTKIEKLPIIEADSGRLSQVLRNLINNAIKFSEKNSKIEILAKTEKNFIFFSVKDYGCGLTSENQLRIFEPFYQVENASRRKHGGTGLGLAICRGIVESQNGKIWVESKSGKGSKFNFTIPLEPVRDIKPIKVLFSNKGTIERKIKEEFKIVLGPLGENEFIELKNKNAIDKEDLEEYINFLIEKFIIPYDRGEDFKNRISKIFGYEKDLNNMKQDYFSDDLGREVLN